MPGELQWQMFSAGVRHEVEGQSSVQQDLR
jgi:uncharacterized protein YaiE (UPF0345 family)